MPLTQTPIGRSILKMLCAICCYGYYSSRFKVERDNHVRESDCRSDVC